MTCAIRRNKSGSGTGSELVEFALLMPLLLLLVAGVWDFGSAFLMKDRMTNAARECARVSVSIPVNSTNCQGSLPCPLVAAADEVRQYMTNAGHDATCIQPLQPQSYTAPARVNYTCQNGIALEIDRGATIASPSGPVSATRVTLTYPLRWTLLRWLLGGALPQTTTTTVTMQNLT
jgi:hypothetical protein